MWRGSDQGGHCLPNAASVLEWRPRFDSQSRRADRIVTTNQTKNLRIRHVRGILVVSFSGRCRGGRNSFWLIIIIIVLKWINIQLDSVLGLLRGMYMMHDAWWSAPYTRRRWNKQEGREGGSSKESSSSISLLFGFIYAHTGRMKHSPSIGTRKRKSNEKRNCWYPLHIHIDCSNDQKRVQREEYPTSSSSSSNSSSEREEKGKSNRSHRKPLSSLSIILILFYPHA